MLGRPAAAETIDDVVGRCPTAAEMAAIDAVITLSFEGNDPSGPTLVCRAADGSRDMTKLQRNVYNLMRAAQKMRFTQPLPWSSQSSVWDWLRLESGISVIRLRGDIGGSSCCSPSNAINLAVLPNSYYSFSDKWLEDLGNGGGLVSSLALIVHEARHRMAGGHTCGSDDQTLTELGAWGAQIYFHLWLDRYSDRDFLRPNTGDAAYYRNWHAQEAEVTRGRICAPPAIATGTVVEFHNNVLNHYFMTISPAEATAIDNGSAGPGWSRTGVTFKAWNDAAQAPLHVRPVCRFYGSITPGPNSHFYTVDPDECAFLKQLQATTPASQPRWNYEGVAFYIGGVVRGTPTSKLLYCGSLRPGTQSMEVSRFYNKRAAQLDSNHRYTVTQAVANQMLQFGWSAEGLVMCSMQ
ncbi:MAG: hypothetical protein ABI831_27155 [Betaproteobacteria bacterium]